MNINDIKVNMKIKFKVSLTIVALLITLCVLLYSSYYMFLNNKDEQSVVVDTPLSINYSSSRVFNEKNNKDIIFSVTNDSAEEVYYNISLNEVVTSNDTNFSLSSDSFETITGLLEDGNIANYVVIEPFATHNYNLNIEYKENEILKGNLNVNKFINKDTTFVEAIKINNEIKSSSTTKIGVEAAITNEGLIETVFDGGKALYYRGVVDNNYVFFAGMIWRIVKVNTDNTVKLVLDSTISDITSYSASGVVRYLESNANLVLQDWFNNNLAAYSDIISNQKYCNDNSLVNNNQTYAAYNRAVVDMIATYNCLGEEINSKIALLTVDELMFAGASVNSDNTSYYLYNSNISTAYYLMSGAKYTGSYNPFVVNPNGKLESGTSSTLIRALRPSISLEPSLVVTGIGTIDNPYILTDY